MIDFGSYVDPSALPHPAMKTFVFGCRYLYLDKFFCYVYLIISSLGHIHLPCTSKKEKTREREYEDAYKYV